MQGMVPLSSAGEWGLYIVTVYSTSATYLAHGSKTTRDSLRVAGAVVSVLIQVGDTIRKAVV